MNHGFELLLTLPVLLAVGGLALDDRHRHDRHLAAVHLAHDAAFAPGTCDEALDRVAAAAAAGGLALGAASAATSGAAPDLLLTVTVELAAPVVGSTFEPIRAAATVRAVDQSLAPCHRRLLP